ncbi:DNA methyltransferase [Streptomyces sp. WAC05374]|uniref:type ISP restriction/modification enzyme n=1 Tax=Streptomyces sp. WAC05374 TaxID=2487420 RepID=UPI000F8713B4|nr:type ISP restriction/modification enzyme [Streptomyces sp. WAC05374]RST06044.1 DNA methyltransferase [Streptomyces sp. WAC05374]TDF40670.1 DNA methyltransferase [Streptomyces sp. WAC05374]TDF49421.1 DNA methyltransferase [Streptomyces sp. WAC05374]TDF49886.1 DNA methyltransferase [Streptomyces sp. WAC05374]
MRRVMEDVPLLDDLMPWSVAPLRLGRSWVVAPDVRTLKSRWDALVRAEGDEREALFGPTRARTLTSSVAALPGQRTGTARFAREAGPCPQPVRLAHGPFDEQWLLPDHRLLDVARPELWRVADERQLFAVEQGYVPQAPGPALLVTGALPDGRSPAGRPGRIRPLYRRPGGREPNLAPGLVELLGARYGRAVAPEEVLAWAVAAARPSPAGCAVPLPADPAVWAAGVAVGRRMTDVQLRGARGGERPRLPGGRRPYVRAALPARPAALAYEAGEETLLVGDGGRIAPVPAEAWDYRVGGVRVLELWFAHRTAPAGPGTLDAVRPAAWPQEWTSELLELITVLTLQAQLEERAPDLSGTDTLTRACLRAAGVLPAPEAARRPASVLDSEEEGPEGQLALL